MTLVDGAFQLSERLRPFVGSSLHSEAGLPTGRRCWQRVPGASNTLHS